MHPFHRHIPQLSTNFDDELGSLNAADYPNSGEHLSIPPRLEVPQYPGIAIATDANYHPTQFFVPMSVPPQLSSIPPANPHRNPLDPTSANSRDQSKPNSFLERQTDIR